MEETKKSRKGQGGNNKMVIKLGGGGSGGVIGAVVLLGVALATAAFASAFVLGQKRRSTDKNHRPNSLPGIDEKISKGAKEEAELEKDSTIHSLKVDDKAKVESDSEKLGDADAISDDGFVIFKEEIPLLAEKEEKDKVQLTQEDVYSKESTNLGQVYIEDGSVERESHGDGEIDTKGRKEAPDGTEMQPQQEENNKVFHDQEDIEVVRADNGVEVVQIDDKIVNVEMNMKKKEFVVFHNGNGETIEEKSVNGYIVHLSPENKVNKEGGEELISPKDVETVKHGGIEKAPQKLELNDNGHKPLVQHPDSQAEQVHGDDVKRATESSVEQEFIDHRNGKATMSKMANGEVPSQNGDSAEVIEKTSSMHTCAAMDNDLSNESLVRRGESSKWEALWQAEWPKASSVKVKLVRYEVGGKVEEDTVVEMAKSTRLRMIVWTLSVLSSLSCSWFFHLSFAKLCLVLFLTVFLLEIYG